MLSTGRFLAIAYTGRKVAIIDVTSAIASIISHDTGPNTNTDTDKVAAICVLRIGHITRQAIIASTKHISVISEDSE